MTNAIKRHPYRAAFAAMIVGLLVACSGPVTPIVGAADPAAAKVTLDAAMQADRDFAAMAKRDGLAAAATAFVDFPNAERFITGQHIAGQDLVNYFRSAPPGLVIDWAPESGRGAASGDLAVTTGRYTATMGGAVIGAGRYVTVWTRNAAGALKVSMDADVPDPAPGGTNPTPDPNGRPG